MSTLQKLAKYEEAYKIYLIQPKSDMSPPQEPLPEHFGLNVCNPTERFMVRGIQDRLSVAQRRNQFSNHTPHHD